MKRYLLIARTTKIARDFAELNKMWPVDYKIAKTARSLDGINNLTAIFIDGWRGRRDAFDVVQAVNMAEVDGVKIIHAKADQVLPTADTGKGCP